MHGSSESFLINSLYNSLHPVCFPENSICDSWYQPQTKKEDTKMELWSWITCHQTDDENSSLVGSEVHGPWKKIEMQSLELSLMAGEDSTTLVGNALALQFVRY